MMPRFVGGFEKDPPWGMCGGVCLETESFVAPGCPITFTELATLSLMIEVHGWGTGTGVPVGGMMMWTSPGVLLTIWSSFLAPGWPMGSHQPVSARRALGRLRAALAVIHHGR